MKCTWDKFGIHASRRATDAILMEHNPNVILRCLNLANVPGVSVQFYDSIGPAIVTVDAVDLSTSLEDARIASRQSGWDVEVHTAARQDQIRQTAVREFLTIETVSSVLAQALIDHGYFNFDDLSVMDPNVLTQLGGLDTDTVDAIIEQAEVRAEQLDG